MAGGNVAIETGAERLVGDRFSALAGRRIGLVTNQTGRVGADHLADLMARAPGITLAAILAPEHGFRGAVEAGAKVAHSVDPGTGAPVFSLYGATRKPTKDMLRGIDALVFDIQDIGTRFYTYIATLGLVMEAAADARIPVFVLDRPNPLGGTYVSGFVLEPALKSFVGPYPIPIVHGMTVGELAHMIVAERWIETSARVDLTVVEMRGWRREMRWPDLARSWVATSPNIPTFEAALVYPGIGIVGELEVSEGRGTPTPFTLFGAPWLDATRVAERMTALRLPGARFSPETYVPQPIPNVASNPRFPGERVNGVRIAITDVARYQPLEVGMHAAALLRDFAPPRIARALVGNPRMLDLIGGTRRLRTMLTSGRSGDDIIAAWQDEVARFRDARAHYLIYG